MHKNRSLHDTAIEFVVGPACPLCQDAGWVVTSTAPPGQHGFATLLPCSCKQQHRQVHENMLREQQSGIGPLRAKRLTGFIPDVPGVRRAYIRACEFAQAPAGWLVLAGGYGCGKTHLAAGIANELLDRHESVIFQVVPDMLAQIRATYSPDSPIQFDAQFHLLCSARCLILDDLGTEQATAWAREKIYQIINHRYNYQLPTVMTTNVWPHGIEPRVASRLADIDLSGGVIDIQAADYRQRKQNCTRME